MSVSANRRVGEDAQRQAALAGSVGVWNVGGEVQRIAAVEPLLVSLWADSQCPVEGNHEFFGPGGVCPAGVVRVRVHAYLEGFDTAVAAVDIKQAAGYPRLEGNPLAVAAADQAAVDRLVLAEQSANGDVEGTSDAPERLERGVTGPRLDGGDDGLGEAGAGRGRPEREPARLAMCANLPRNAGRDKGEVAARLDIGNSTGRPDGWVVRSSRVANRPSEYVDLPRHQVVGRSGRPRPALARTVLNAQNDRYEPLPGLLSVPSFLYRKLGPRGRIAVKLGGGLFVVAVTVAAIVLVPRIAATNRERAEKERRDAAAALAERRRRLIEEQRPHRGRADPGASRAVAVVALEGRILADARARVAAGKLDPPAAKRVDCKPIPHGQDPNGARVAYDCVAVTSDLPSIGTQPGGVIGHPFRAVVQFSTGRLTWCKVSGRANIDLGSRAQVTIPRVCSL
jgi:hypothetical protein